jgi:flagellum-specific ATP synthase
VRSILDGHIVLTRSLAHSGHYPAIDVLQSVSRLVGEIVTPDVQAAGQQVRAALAAYRDKEDLISIGAYQRGSDPLVDVAIDQRSAINAFLRQRPDDPTDARDSDGHLLDIGGTLGLESPVPPPADAFASPDVQTASPAGGPSAIPSLSLA